MKTIEFEKKGIKFTATVKAEDISVSQTIVCKLKMCSSLGDEVDSLRYIIKDGTVKFSGYISYNNSRVDGIRIDDQDVLKQLEEAYEEAKKEATFAYNKHMNECETDRPAPQFDFKGYIRYSYGCDTGLIYPEHKRDAINRALKNGAKEINLYRGERNTEKHKGCMDNNIPNYYVKFDSEGKPFAVGYDYVYVDAHCISEADYKAALAEIENSDAAVAERVAIAAAVEKENVECEQESFFDINLLQTFREDDSTAYLYAVTKKATGESFKFFDRNVEDFGRVINPRFTDIDGGLLQNENGVMHWLNYNEKSRGWYPVREATADELIAYRIVEKRGFGDREIRM